MITFFPADFVALKDVLMKLFLLQGFMIFSFIILASIHHYPPCGLYERYSH